MFSNMSYLLLSCVSFKEFGNTHNLYSHSNEAVYVWNLSVILMIDFKFILDKFGCGVHEAF